MGWINLCCSADLTLGDEGEGFVGTAPFFLFFLRQAAGLGASASARFCRHDFARRTDKSANGAQEHARILQFSA